MRNTHSGGAADPLVRTKLHLPRTRPELVSRPRLDEQFAQALRGRLILVAAPAGFGKTTLVASCIARCGWPVAWLSLDRHDNETGRFLSYLVAAIQETDPSIGCEAARLLSATQPAPPETILASLINDLDGRICDTVVVLDDYQFIHNQTVHAAVAYLLDHCPVSLHVIMSTRSDPPLPLARLRAASQLVEFRTADLSFTEAEAATFLNDVMGLHLSAGSVAVLKERTEGWIAGLQMAALSLRHREDGGDFIEGFTGTNRYILDYLLEEVLANQPPEIQQFLLATSILERLSAPLCDAITGDHDGEGVDNPDPLIALQGFFPSPSPSAAILAYLERANLFLVPLDDERSWYRYHHLFADLLRTQLQRLLGAQGVAQLHVRAADWHAQNGSLLEAIQHASMASDDERVERFIEQNYRELVSDGEQSGIRAWTGKLSPDLILRRPWLCIYEAMSHAWFGELDEAERFLKAAEERIPSVTSVCDGRAIQAVLAHVKSRVAAMRGDMQQAIEYSLVARELISSSDLALQLDVRITLGYEYFLSGDFANAGSVLEEMIRLGINAGAVINTIAASCVLARMYAIQGALRKSYGAYQQAASLIPSGSGQHLGARALVELGLADVLCELNELGDALAHVERGLNLLPWWGKADDVALAYLTLAKIHRAAASRHEAAAAVTAACEAVQTSGVFTEARRAAESAQVGLWLAQGDLQAASRWAAAQKDRLYAGEPIAFENELAYLTLARVLVTQNKPGEAVSLLEHLAEPARSSGRMGRVISILLLKALALQAMGDTGKARRALTECLTLAEPEGYVRLFVDEGRPMQTLLTHWLAHAPDHALSGYVTRLLAHFEREPSGAVATPAGGLVEPLSPRELEVLQLLSLGQTNLVIARQLVVAPGTVKAHTASIYRKLDVANRTEAAARARQLGILA